nr:hypothetical protein [uncultured Pedobacter sp.]
MKKLLLSVFLLISVVAVKAQGQGGGGQRQMLPPAERASAVLSNERFASFKFTDDQKAKIAPLLTKFYTSSDSLMKTIPQDGDRREAFQTIMPKRMALATPVEESILAILTPEQKKEYDAALAAVKERNPNATSVFTSGWGGRPRN